MRRRPPRTKRTDTLLPYKMLFRSVFEAPALGNRKGGDKMENNPADPWVMPPIREGHEAPPPILERRAQLRGLAALHPRDSAVAICEKDIGGVSCQDRKSTRLNSSH